jgi:hypothetical protein
MSAADLTDTTGRAIHEDESATEWDERRIAGRERQMR